MMSVHRTLLFAALSAVLAPGCDTTASPAGSESGGESSGAKTSRVRVSAKASAPAKVHTGPPPSKSAVRGKNGAVLQLGRATIHGDGSNWAFALAQDGTLSADGSEIGTVSPNGRLKFTIDGFTMRLKAKRDGRVFEGGEPTNIRLSDTGGTFVQERRHSVSFEDNGAVRFSPPIEEMPQMTHDGCAGAMARTCALIVIALF